MTNDPHVRSITAKLKNLAQKKNATYPEILTQFLIERAVARICSDEQLVNHLVFKGGFVGIKVYSSTRFTTDLDAISYRKSKEEVISLVKQALANDLHDHVWFHYESEVDLLTQGEYGGIRLSYRFGLGTPPNDKRKAQIFHFDLGNGDPITPAPKKDILTPTIGNEPLTWNIYPIETIISEKLHPLVSLGSENSRSKDIFDLAHLLPKADPAILKNALKATFDYRGDKLPSDLSVYLSNLDLTKIKRGWASATASIQSQPNFDESVTTIIKWLKNNNI